MGACDFFTIESGPSAKAAFRKAVDEALYEYGHGGYTGSIAEKHNFVMISCPPEADPTAYAEDLLARCDRRIEDKWGPAGCIKIPESDKYIFFGYASS